MADLNHDDFENLPIKKLDKKRKYLKVFANDNIQNLFLWADQNSESLDFNFDPNASTQDYLIVTNKKSVSFIEMRNKIKKCGLKTIMIKRTPRVIHNIDEDDVKINKYAEIQEIAQNVVLGSIIFAYAPRIKRQKKKRGPTKMKNKLYYRKNKQKIKRNQKVYRRKHKPQLTRRKKMRHFKRIP